MVYPNNDGVLKRLFTFLLLIPLSVNAQFYDGFDDGNFSSNPSWGGTSSKFIVNISGQLQLNAAAVTDTAYLYTDFSPNLGDTVTWQLYWRMNFAPSSNNTSRIYLMSSDTALGSNVSGYYLRIGESGSTDPLRLERQDGSNSTNLITGTSSFGTNPELYVKVIRDPSGGWSLLSAPNSTGPFTFEGDTTDNTYTTSNFFGLWCKYTTSNSTDFYFDDISADSVVGDTTAPQLIGLSTPGAQTIELVFNEALDQNSAETVSNYSVAPGLGSPTSASLLNDTLVQLQFASSFISGATYTLAASGITDLSGNQIDPISEEFTFLNFGVPQFRDVVINEIMADPSPPVALPEIEFVEIYNSSNAYFDLSSATFGDPSTIGNFPSDEILSPGEYVILCDEDDTSAFASYGRVIGLDAFPALNNGGDELTLTIAGELVDQLTYDDSWYVDPGKDEGGFSLEQINLSSPCNGPNNWRGSDDLDGGTPGQQNSIYDTIPDSSIPILTQLEVVSLTEIHLSFDKFMDSASLATASYSFTPNLTIDSVDVAVGFQMVRLILQTNIDSATHYTLTVDNVNDCIGNSSGEIVAEVAIGVSPQSFDIVINEIYPDPDEASAIPAFEFVELFNRSDKLLRVDQLSIGDASGSSSLQGSFILPGEYMIVCDDGYVEEFLGLGKVIPVTTMPSLNNDADELSLSRGNKVIDQVSYTKDWYGSNSKASGGFTLERINPNDLCGTQGNWSASSDLRGGTPGVFNSILDTTEVPVGIRDIRFTSIDELNISLTHRLDTTFLSSIFLNGDEVEYELQSDETMVIAVKDSFERGQSFTVSIDTLTSCAGQHSFEVSASIYLHDSGDVVINEVLFNPRKSGTDFIELLNNSDAVINLRDWSLGYYDSNDSLNYNTISLASLFISTDEYICLNEDGNNLLVNYPQAFETNFHTTNLPSYPNDTGDIWLFDQFGELMDQVHYSEGMHFALINDADGVSLERMAPESSGLDRDNWHSASANVGFATPGYINSQFYPESLASAGWSLSAEYISPDNDGYQDVVRIEYLVSNPGYSATIRVYNERGVLIRTIVSGALLGSSGSFTWDGTNDSGEKARTGIHVIIVESFDLTGALSKKRLPVIVATKLR